MAILRNEPEVSKTVFAKRNREKGEEEAILRNEAKVRIASPLGSEWKLRNGDFPNGLGWQNRFAKRSQLGQPAGYASGLRIGNRHVGSFDMDCGPVFAKRSQLS